MTRLSSSLSPTNPATAAVAAELSPIPRRLGLRGMGRMYLELAKARLSGMVVVTAAVGYLVGARGRVDGWTLLWLVVGTSLAAGCANAMNQVLEAERDAKMGRTARRPLPSGRMGLIHAAAAAVLAGGAGMTLLAAMINGLTAALALLTIAVYLLIYTPLKVRSTLNTLAGAVVGAIPPMMGWAAANNSLEAGAWALAALLFVWQVPHFLALAWLFRDDYERGGYRMLPLVDPTGVLTCRTVLMWSAALVPVALTVMLAGVSGYVYALCSMALGGWLLTLAWGMHRDRSHASARRMFLATVMYLPILMAAMVLDDPGQRYEPGRPSLADTAVVPNVTDR